jgi:disulfide bond formation protein DsbB
MSRADVLLGGVAALGVGAVAAALFTQYRLDMQPCAWCVLQRLVFLGISDAALLGLLWRTPLGRRVSALAVLALATAGAAAALWQHFVAASSVSCDLTLADRIVAATGLDGWLPEVFMATASCADAAVDLIGLPYEFWSLGLFIAAAAAALAVVARPADR